MLPTFCTARCTANPQQRIETRGVWAITTKQNQLDREPVIFGGVLFAQQQIFETVTLGQRQDDDRLDRRVGHHQRTRS